MIVKNNYVGEHKDILSVFETAIIKRIKELEVYETKEMTDKFSKYRYAYNKLDTVYEHTYSVSDYNAVGLTDTETIIKINRDIRSMSAYLSEAQMDLLLSNKRAEIISTYVEKNRYVLTLMGQPYREDDWVYVGYHIDGVTDDIPLHKMTDGEITVLENKGVLDTIIAANQDKEYLNFINRRVSFYTTRTAEEFGLLYVNTSDYSVAYQVAEIYEHIRLAFMRTIYNKFYMEEFTYYEAMMISYLLAATLYNIIIENSMTLLDFDFTSDSILDNIFKTFSIPYIEDLPKSVRVTLAEKINRILINKGNKQSIIDIADAFGVKDIYQYVLYKEYKDATVGYDPSKTPAENYKVSFVKVPLKESDIHKYIYAAQNNEELKIPYDEFVADDLKWGYDGDKLKDYVLKQDFSYLTTKYIGIENVISLTKAALTQTEFFSFLFANKKRLGDFSLTLNRPGIQTSLWDAFIYSVILIHNKNGFEDDIIQDPLDVAYIMGVNSQEYLTSEVITQYKRHLPPEYWKLLDYKMVNSSLNISQFMDVAVHNTQTLAALRLLVREWEGDYETYKQLYDLECAIHHMKLNTYLGDMKNFNTYSDYLASSNPVLYTHLQAIKGSGNVEEEMTEELETLINDLESYLNPNGIPERNELLYFLNKISEDEASTVRNSLFKMITFLKSYTIDMKASDTTYSFEDYIKVIEQVMIKNHIYAWDRTYVTDQLGVSFKATKIESFVHILDKLHKDGCRDRSHVLYPPWVTVVPEYEYIQPDYSTFTHETLVMIASKTYLDFYTDIEDKLKIYVTTYAEDYTDIHDTLVFQTQYTYLNFYTDISMNLKVFDEVYSSSRLTENKETFIKLTPNETPGSFAIVMDSLRRLDTGRLQTDITSI